MLKHASIYWIHLPEHTDPLTEGYLGVSINVARRLDDHIKDIVQNKHKNPHLTNAVTKYGWDNLIKETIFTGDEALCYEKEEEMRPKKAIGWNIAPGGHKGPGWTKGKKRSPETIQKMIEKQKIKNEEKRKLKIENRRKRLAEKQQKRLEKEQQEQLARYEKRKLKEQRAKEKAEKEFAQISERQRRKLLSIGIFGPSNYEKRPICKSCNKNLCSVNYKKAGITHYRSICDECGRKKKKEKPKQQNWAKAGYKKKPHCDLCGFKGVYPSQLTVFHIDGDLNNTVFSNLRTICLNCVEVVKRKEVTWKRGDLTVDY